ncbi:DUF1642 domain-containing protein [Lactococcus lactis]|uniref:DUF1642 domain-containing protein n=1 Tax=Lactococcus lactis TaxID=1358 RepID=UPI002418AA4C|nr:DUF1642 domain-containing protein [Lactococcus lactis]MDG4966102.1 DUF1642 domain-containing protein [Lactococcus lactis]
MTKTFEKDLNEKLNSEKVPMYITQNGCSLTRKTFIETNWLFANYGNYHSDKEFHELSEKLDDANDALVIAQNSRDEFEREYKKLKSQLQQQVLPVIPDYVAQLVDYTVKVQHTIPSDIIGYFYFRNEQFSIEDMNLPNDILDLEKLSEYFKIGLHRFEFERACIIGYKSQLFYLKNKLTGMYLAYDGMNDLYEVWETKAHKFTQQEIGSMNTWSYEQIEVTE